jgi:hypothetical protein
MLKFSVHSEPGSNSHHSKNFKFIKSYYFKYFNISILRLLEGIEPTLFASQTNILPLYYNNLHVFKTSLDGIEPSTRRLTAENYTIKPQRHIRDNRS